MVFFFSKVDSPFFFNIVFDFIKLKDLGRIVEVLLLRKAYIISFKMVNYFKCIMILNVNNQLIKEKEKYRVIML